MRQLFFSGKSFFLPSVTVVFRGGCLACFEDFVYKKVCSLLNKVRSDVHLGARLRVAENRCVLFNPSTYVHLALLPQH